MKKIIFAIILLAAAFGLYKLVNKPSDVVIGEPVVYKDVLNVSSPRPNEVIGNPLIVKGFARGNWFFEGSFPVVITDWDGKIIGQHYAEVDPTYNGTWMTDEYVPFTATLSYTSPYQEGNEASKRGAIIMRKDNPSGLPENEDSYELPIRFVK